MDRQHSSGNRDERLMASIQQQDVDRTAALPAEIVTFLLTDVEGSTRLWEESFDAMSKALEQHDAIMKAVVDEHRGVLIKSRSEGDSQFSVFADGADAVAAALSLQRAFSQQTWPTPAPIRVRMGVHTGEAGLHEGEYYGKAITRAARVRGIAYGGQVVLSKAASDMVGARLPDGATLKDLGAHRLKDLSTPEQMYQLVHPDLQEEFPSLRSLDAHPNNLPIRLTNFIGRDPELAELKRLLETERFVTLTGAEGIGKTRLALQVAAERFEEFPHGVWLVELGAVNDPALVPKAIASSVGVRGTTPRELDGVNERRKRPVERGLVNYLRPYRLLILLDQCDAVKEICRELARIFLPKCPGVTVLATAREALGGDGEIAWPVPPLSVPDPDAQCSPDSLARFESARLFVDRARLARPDFEVTDRDAPWIAQICRELGGNPLHIKLAAQWLKVLSCEQIALRLARDPDRLLRRRANNS